MHFGININNQRGNKMTFIFTCNPENSIKEVPNSPSSSAKTDFVVRKYGKNMLRNISPKVSRRKTEKGKPRETRDRSGEPALADHHTPVPTPKKRDAHSGCRLYHMTIYKAPNRSGDTVCTRFPWKWICHWR